MSCKIKIKSLDYLKEKKAISNKREIIDLTTFEELNTALTLLAETKYGVKSPDKSKLFSVTTKYVKNLNGTLRFVMRAEVNDKLFDVLEKVVNEYEGDEVELNLLSTLVGVNNNKLQLVKINEKEPFSAENEAGTLSEFILFGNQEGKSIYDATEVLDNIMSHYKGFNSEAEFVLERAKILSLFTKAKVKIVNKEELQSETSYMQYNPSSNTIKVSLENIREYSTKFAVKSFLHEVVHSISVNAFRNPQTTDQKIFRNFIREAYTHYKMLDKLGGPARPTRYGFVNEVEFIAEIFSNPRFIRNIKKIDSNTPTTLWAKIVDAIRSLLSLPRTSKNNSKISYNKVIDSIIDIADTAQVPKSDVFSIHEMKNPIKKDIERYTDLSTLDAKMDYTIDKLEQSLIQNIKSLEFSAKITKDEEKVKNIENYIESFTTILSDVKDYRISNKIAAVSTFIGSMDNNLSYIRSRIDNIDYENPQEIKSALNVYKSYLSTFSVVKQISSLLADIKQDEETQEIVTEEDLVLVEEALQKAIGEYTYLNDRMYSVVKKGMKVLLNDIKYHKQVELKHRNRLAKEHKDSGIPTDKEIWVIDQMQNRDKELIAEDVSKATDSLIEDPSYDVMGADVMFSSAVNVSSPLIQIMNQIIFDIKNEKNEEMRQKTTELRDAFDKLVTEKGTNNITTLYKNILTQDNTGKYFLKSEYDIKFFSEVHNKIKELRKERRELNNEGFDQLALIKLKKGIDSVEYANYRKQLKEKTTKLDNQITKLQDDNVNFNSEGNVTSIKDKWKTDFSSLSETEKKVLDLFTNRIEESHKSTYGQKSLINYSFKTKFYELPKVTKTDLERLLFNKGKGILKDKKKDLTELRADDVGYSTIKTDLDDNRIFNLKVQYRDTYGNFKNEDQSLDLFNIIRLETENGQMFKTRREYEAILLSLIEIAKNKKYYQKEGTNKLVNHFSKKYSTIEGDKTNTYIMMKNLMEQKFYDIFNKNNVKLGKYDLNKTVKFINSSSAFLTLSLNIASGTANVLNANAQLFLESFIKGKFIDAKGIAKANRIYGNDMPNIISDITNPINKGFVNQVNELFDTKDSLNLTTSGFLRTNMVKAGMDLNALQIFHTSGEHWVQSVIALAVLDKIKALDSNGKYINTEGKPATEKNAASLLDMLKVNDVDGTVTMNDKVVYTTHSRLTKWNEGGKTNIDLLIRKKLYDSIGNYTQLDQPDIMRSWGGKLMMLYRKYLIPMGQARLRGWETALKHRENLTEHDKRFSFALQENEEGTYVSLVRFLNEAILNKKAFVLAKPKWDSLSDYEKHNIKRAVLETVMVYAMLPAVLALVKGMADGEDDDFLFFLAYQIRRLDTEMSQYQSMGEMFKMMRSPIPSARLLETAGSVLTTIANPISYFDGTFTEEYKAGTNKGKNKFGNKLLKQIPVVKEFQRSYQDLLQYQESNFGTGL